MGPIFSQTQWIALSGLGHVPICTPGMPLKMESTILGGPDLGLGLDSKEIMHHSQNCKSSG
jgi:hypothetical protein